MHANVVNAPSRAVYVPAPKRPKPKEAEFKPTRLGQKKAITPIAALMRSVAWTGEPDAAVEATPPAPARPRLGAHTKARDLFAQVRWTGETDAAPTEVQLANSVKNVFDSFGWE